MGSPGLTPLFFGGMVFVFYNLCAFLGIRGKENHEMNENQLWTARNMTELVIAMFFCSFFIVWLFPSYLNLFLYPLPLYILAGLYLLPNSYLRRNVYLKPSIISLIWVLLPILLIAQKIPEGNRIALFFLFSAILFLFVFNLSIVYDAKDVDHMDENSMYKNLGVQKIGMLVLFNTALIILLLLTIPERFTLALIPFFLFHGVVLYISRNIKNALWHLLVIDGFLGLLGLYYFIIQYSI